MKLSWRNIRPVAFWEFSKGARSPMFLFMTILIPIIMIISGGASYLAETMERDRAMTIAVYEEEDLLQSYLAEESLPDNVSIALWVHDETEAQLALEQGTVEGYLVVTSTNLEQGVLPFYASDLRQVNPNGLRAALQGPISRYRLDQLELNSEVVLAATAPIQLRAMEWRDGQEADLSLAAMMVPLAIAMVLVMSALLSGQVLMHGVIKEKRNRVVEILLSSLSAPDLLMGKILGVGALSLLQILIWVGAALLVGAFLFDLGSLEISLIDLAPSLLFFFFGFFLLASMFAALGSTMKEAEESSQAQGLVVLIPMAPLFAAGVLMSQPNATWAVVLSHVPPFIPTMVLLRMAVTDLPLWQMASTLAALVVSIFVFVWIGAKVFERGILQYDKSLGIREIVKIFKG